MDAALKGYLLASKASEAQLWIASNGVVVSGRTTKLVDFFAEIMRLSGQDVEEYYKIVDEVMAEGGDEPTPEPAKGKLEPLILFADANVFINGRFAFCGPVSVDPEKIGVWGPGLMSPRED